MADAFPISGNIDPKAFPFLLMDLHRNGATGSLKVEGPSYQKALYYRSGRILFGSSNDPRDQLGAILIEAGKITPEQLEDVNAKVGPGSPLAKVLADSGFVSQRELGEAARAKVERILSDVIAYDTGNFEFEDGVLPKGAVDLKLSTERLVLAAVRRLQDRNFVLRHLGGLDVVLRTRDNSEPHVAEIRAEAGGLAEQLDGQRSLKEAAGLTRLEEFDAAKVACALLFLGIVERTDAAAPISFVDADSELDLGQTARMAIGDTAPAAGASETGEGGTHPAFFVPDAPPPAAEEMSAFSFADPPVPPPGLGEEPAPEIPIEAPPAPPAAPPIAAPSPPAPVIPAPVVLAPTAPAREAAPPIPPPPIVPPPATTAASPRSALPLQPPPPRRTTARPPEPALMVPQTSSRPSKEDLAALDALLNSRTAEGPLEPLQKGVSRPSQNWEPRFGQQAERDRKPRHKAGPSPLLLGALAAVVVLAAAGGWLYFKGGLPGKTPPGTPFVQARPTAVPSVPVATASTTLAAAPSTTLTTSALTTLAQAPPPTTPSPAPRSRTSTTTKTSATVSDARDLMQRGDLPAAARAFAAAVRSSAGSYSVQLLVACSADTVQKALQNVSAQELYVVPVNYKGRDCYRLCWGVYESESSAGAAVRTVPDYFVKGGASPKVVATSSILP